MRKGSITVFLSGVLLVLFSLILACVEAVRFYAAGTEAECAVYVGLDAVFAEYNRELLERYDLFFIDSSYGYAQPDYHNTEAHLWDYIKSNLSVDDVIARNARDFLSMRLEGLSITGASLATDDYGRDVKYQAIAYMRERVGLTLIEELQGQIGTLTGNGLDTRNVEQEAAEVQAQIDGVPLPMEQLEDGSFVAAQVDNPVDGVNSGRFRGILYLVAEHPSEISEQAINPDNYVSNRRLNTGTGPVCGEISFGPTDEILFGEYLLEKCGSYLAPSDEGALRYELEYILGGKSSDTENLRWVAGRLVLIREAANALYLFSDSVKVAEADALAWGLAIVALEPSLQPLIKNSILLAWAYAESILDVRALLSGGKVPLLKTKETWRLSIGNMLEYVSHLGDDAESEKGLDYETYLRMLLFLEDGHTKTLRFLDVIEMNLRTTPGNAAFRMDGCIDGVTIEAEISGDFGEYYNITAHYSYLGR